MRRRLLTMAGLACVGLGLVGVVVPVLPTTPFLLLAAFLLARSSPRFHAWLLTNPLFGSYLSGYLQGRGLPLHAKIITIGLLWASILVSVLALTTSTVARIVLLTVAAAVTVHIVTIRRRR